MTLLKSEGELPTPKRLSQKQVNDVINTSDDIDSLLKRDGDYFVCWNNWMVLPTNKESIKLGLKPCTVFASYYNTDVNSHVTALSLSTWVPVTNERVRIDFYFYGDGYDVLYGHLRAHVECFLAECSGEMCVLEVHFPSSLDSAPMERTLSAHLGNLYFYTEKATECILVSQPIEKDLH